MKTRVLKISFPGGLRTLPTLALVLQVKLTNVNQNKTNNTAVYHLLTFQSGFNDDASCLNNQNSISLYDIFKVTSMCSIFTCNFQREDCAKAIYELGTATEPGSTFYYR